MLFLITKIRTASGQPATSAGGTFRGQRKCLLQLPPRLVRKNSSCDLEPVQEVRWDSLIQKVCGKINGGSAPRGFRIRWATSHESRPWTPIAGRESSTINSASMAIGNRNLHGSWTINPREPQVCLADMLFPSAAMSAVRFFQRWQGCRLSGAEHDPPDLITPRY